MIKFVQFRNDLLIDKNLKDNVKYLYAVMLSYIDKNGKCYFKRETLAEKSGICITAITNILKKLETAGYLKINTQYFNGRKSNNSYELNINMSDDIGFTYLNYDILFNEKLDNQDIMQYLKMKRFVNNQTFIFINTKAKLLELVGCDKKKFYKCLDKLQENNIINVEQNDTKCTLTLIYELNRIEQPEQVVEKELLSIKETIDAWRNLNVKDCAI